ncbi:MAG: hypothetical protein SFW35_01375 [Chitinophagales bacterium]|nr:hypothetical protein [Chitinophagales bacterium]
MGWFNYAAIKNYLIFFGFVTVTFLVGEVHPFSHFPMYNSFPNWSYAFFITDERNDTLFFEHHFRTSAGPFAHQFYTICQHKGFAYGNRIETKAQLQEVGKAMLGLIEWKNKPSKTKMLRLYRRTFMLTDGKLNIIDELMAEKSITDANK